MKNTQNNTANYDNITLEDDFNFSRRELNRLKDIKQRSITRSTDKYTKVTDLDGLTTEATTLDKTAQNFFTAEKRLLNFIKNNEEYIKNIISKNTSEATTSDYFKHSRTGKILAKCKELDSNSENSNQEIKELVGYLQNENIDINKLISALENINITVVNKTALPEQTQEITENNPEYESVFENNEKNTTNIETKNNIPLTSPHQVPSLDNTENLDSNDQSNSMALLTK